MVATVRPLTEIAQVGPYDKVEPITPSDTVDLPTMSRGIYVGGAGDISLQSQYGIDATVQLFKAVPVGTILRVKAHRVLVTGTTATNLLCLS